MSNFSAKIIAGIIFVWFGGILVQDVFEINILNSFIKILIVSVIFILLVIALVIDIKNHIKKNKCDRWKSFLEQNIKTPEAIDQVQEFAGYCFTSEKIQGKYTDPLKNQMARYLADTIETNDKKNK